MKCMENLLDALADCGEAALFYRGQHVIRANRLLAALFEREQDEFDDLPVVDLCHEDSMEMILDFIKRRAFGDLNLPTTYRAYFITASNSKLELQITVIKTTNTEGAYLAIFQK
ncbi:MAG: hypothetical protein JW814_01885 [Candidatus Krumholzibacteriota bacterium]|nr:hypothetical protein [Candidatus Krumholzibacteriota bacterium]